ncbi:periphilin-1 [Oryzias melastigma]|uniref:Periphilin 1 n=1 Tax=Oryzias melastigma TaxID=30732 RepID=A0A3B3BV35_ORYME|nr:periphilin-1 [Oryzias melastigma]
MSYQWGQRSIREQYEDHFSHDTREVTVHRVVNIVEKRNLGPRPAMEYDRGFNDHSWYGGSQYYKDTQGYYTEDGYPPNDEQYFDEKPYYGSFGRSSSQQQIEGPYSHRSYGKDDLRHQLSSRKSSRGQPFRKRGGRQSYPPRDDRDDFRANKSLVITRERSPVKKETPSSPAASRSFTPDSDKSYSHQQAQQKHKSSSGTSQSSSSSVKDSPSSSSKDQTPASAAESEEVAAASAEPELTPEEDLKARRLEAIKAKAVEIEKDYKQDCETFRTVVKMLIDKEPALENLLEAPLAKNLQEIKQHCLDALKGFISELDEILEQPESSS